MNRKCSRKSNSDSRIAPTKISKKFYMIIKTTGGRLRALPVADEASNKEWQRLTIGKWRQPAQTESGNATGIVRRTEARVIITQKCGKAL